MCHWALGGVLWGIGLQLMIIFITNSSGDCSMINNLFFHNMSKNGEKNSHHDLLQPEVDVPTNNPKPNSSLSIIKSKVLE